MLALHDYLQYCFITMHAYELAHTYTCVYTHIHVCDTR